MIIRGKQPGRRPLPRSCNGPVAAGEHAQRPYNVPSRAAARLPIMELEPPHESSGHPYRKGLQRPYWYGCGGVCAGPCNGDGASGCAGECGNAWPPLGAGTPLAMYGVHGDCPGGGVALDWRRATGGAPFGPSVMEASTSGYVHSCGAATGERPLTRRGA